MGAPGGRRVHFLSSTDQADLLRHPILSTQPLGDKEEFRKIRAAAQLNEISSPHCVSEGAARYILGIHRTAHSVVSVYCFGRDGVAICILITRAGAPAKFPRVYLARCPTRGCITRRRSASFWGQTACTPSELIEPLASARGCE